MVNGDDSPATALICQDLTTIHYSLFTRGRHKMQLSLDQATGLCRMAALGAGANQEAAQSLVASIIAAEAQGLSTVGLSHFIDYLEALEAGRIDGNADPVITRPALAVYLSDARGGLAHTGFDRSIEDL